MPKIVFLGAGSTVFARNLLKDLFTFPELHSAELALIDIDPQRLRDTETIAHHEAKRAGATPTITAHLDRRQGLAGADYVINMIQVGGYQPSTVIDFEIPKKYGLVQTIGDTVGIGGIMRALRTIPVMLDVARDMEQLCPKALLLNYTNPMAMLTWTMNRATNIQTVGLCHSVQYDTKAIARWTGVPAQELHKVVAGINHMAFFLKLEHRGRDLYPALFDIIDNGNVPPHNRVRFEMMRRVGFYVTESSEHFAEYVPWFITSHQPELIDRFNIPLDEYPRRCVEQIAGWERMRATLLGADAEENGEAVHSDEYASLIIHSMETGVPRVVNGNVMNNGLIDNLPRGCCVEVPCLVDGNGIQPTVIGSLPPQLAALIQTNVSMQGMTVEAALTRKREHIYHAAMLDPRTAAELNLDQIWALVDDLLEAHVDYLPAYT
jgi:alpha-galactosidase